MKTFDAYNDTKLCALVYASDIYESGKNIFQSFEPLLETAIESFGTCNSISFIEFQNRVNDLYKVNIPKTTLLKLLEELERGGKIRFVKKNLIFPVIDSNDELIQVKRCREKEISDLFFSFREYILKKNKEISYEEAKRKICKYIFNHCYDLIDFIGGISRAKPFEDEDDTICELCDFLFDNRERNSAQYRAFLNLYNGAVQSTLLNFNPDKIDQIQDDGFKIDQVVLDTNFVMRLLDIQTENEYIMAKETYDSLNEMRVRFIVLKETLTEITRSIRAYLYESQPYAADTQQYYKKIPIRASGLLSAAQRGRERADFLANSTYNKLKSALESKYGVIVIEDFNKHEFEQDNVISLIRSKNREGYSSAQAEHDLLLIEYCIGQRGKQVDSFKNAKCWVLTNDIKLTFWNQQNCTNVQECMTETQLSNLLWLMARKEDNLGLANTMIAIANSEMTDHNTFYKFAFQMKKYRELIKDDPEKINDLALVFACDSITEEDIKHISKSQQGIEELIQIKSENIKNERIKLDEKLSHNIEENADLSYQLYLAKKELEISNLEKEIMKCNEVLSKKGTEIDKLENIKFVIHKLQKYIPKAAREVACRLFLVSVISLFILYVIYYMFWPQIFEKLKFLQNEPDWLISLFFVVIPPILYLILCLILLLVTGKPIKPGDIIVFLRDKKVGKYAKKNNIECKIEALPEYLMQVVKNIKEEKLYIVEITEQIQDKKRLKEKKENEVIDLKEHH